ncbi:MAG: 3-phosphoshikimate 1-carboxyvinyltransferase [Acholeplasma sp.]|nr:3-phosphoshikimate 1-carboxyvinyltransferase [Acholeplasma sp.]
MKSLEILESKITGTINIVASKSLSHRYVIAGSLARGESRIVNVLESKDLEATITILKIFGVRIRKENNTYYIDGTNFQIPKDILYANESGSTLRFLIPIAWLFDEEVVFDGKASLGIRPLTVYEQIAHDFGYQLVKKDNSFPITTKGPLRSGEYVVDGSISSQFFSGLLFALPLVKGDSIIVIKGGLSSKGYVDLTLDVLKEAGIVIEKNDNVFTIKGNQTYQPLTKEIEGDYSQAAFFIVAAIITNRELTIKGLNKNSKQGDREILTIINKIGVDYCWDKNDDLVIKRWIKTKDTVIDLNDIPDLGPVLMVLSSVINNETKFLNVHRLKIKESNRLDAMLKNLEKLNVKYQLVGNELIINGGIKLDKKVIFETYNDHRIAMALSVLGLIADKGIIINDYEVINKSYPSFYQDLERIGGKIKYDK